jgi:hypothetical protein
VVLDTLRPSTHQTCSAAGNIAAPISRDAVHFSKERCFPFEDPMRRRPLEEGQMTWLARMHHRDLRRCDAVQQ